MKLYFAPGACSLAPHIALIEAGLPFEAVQVSTKSHKLKDGSDFYLINPLGYVPVLELDDGTRLTEGPAIDQYIADLAPERQLAPPNGTLARYQLQSLLNFISTELHKSFSPLFTPGTPEETKAAAHAKLASRYTHVNTLLEGRQHLTGDTFTIADAYLFNVTSWCRLVQVDLQAHGNVRAFMERVAARPAVQAAMKAEGLLK